MNFVVSTWEELTRDQLHAILRLRIDVFVVEQNCPYPDLDTKDLKSLHVHSMNPGKNEGAGDSASSYLRICKPGVSYSEPSIGRVATSKSARGSGLGKKLMEKGIEICEKRWPGQGIRISAQKYLGKFYTDLGFEVCSDPYLEDNIPHVQMFRK
jgi:ElaA protein